MATFVMVPGAWHGSWAFEPLREGLAARGHAMVALDLPGMGADAAAVAEATLDRWAAHVAEACRAHPGAILCGHSRGGIVISQAAEVAPEAIGALVYICAFLIPDGRSLNDLTADEPRSEAFAAGLSPTADGLALALSAGGATAAFYSGTALAFAEDACARLVAEPLAPLGTPLALSDARFGSVPRHYIECSEDQAIPLRQQRAMQAALPCATTTTLASDHSPFLGCPDALVAALDAIARGA